MIGLADWPPAAALHTARLALEPLRVAHADEMAPLLADPRLHAYTGGASTTVAELRGRYLEQVNVWSVSATERWLNWIVRDVHSSAAVGGVQAQLRVEDGDLVGELAWMVGAPYQRRGYALEASAAAIAWLRDQAELVLVADIHPDNAASMALARALGLRPTQRPGAAGTTRWIG